MFDLLLVFVTASVFLPLCTIVSDFITRKLGYKENGVFFVLANLCLISLEGILILYKGPGVLFYTLLVSIVGLVGVLQYDKHKTFEL